MYRNVLFITRFLHIEERELMMTKSHTNNVDAAFFKKIIFQSYINYMFTNVYKCLFMICCQDPLIADKCFAIEAVMY